ncbi:MAG: hypothetical protein RLZZ245_1379 [Verrucomicrobiota bacterium]
MSYKPFFNRHITATLAVLLLFIFASDRGLALNMETVTVGDPGNAADDTGFGSVPTSFAIGTYEVTNSQYAEFLNAVDPSGVNPNGIFHTGMHHEARGGILFRSFDPIGGKYSAKAVMANKPVNFVNWFDAARFVNWLHHGQPRSSSTEDSFSARETGAYTLNNALSGAILRNPEAKWWIPSENQWYKAAYYKRGGTNAGYWDYPTRSQSYAPPSSITADSVGNGPGGTGNRANFNKAAAWNPSTEANTSAIASPTTVGTNGGPSAYGAFDMGGNAMEINDAVFYNARGRRGGGYDSSAEFLSAAQRGTSPFSNDTSISLDGIVNYTLATMQQGFRVATGVEPILAQTTRGTVYSNAVSVSSKLVDSGGATLIECGFILSPAENQEPVIGDQGVIKAIVPGVVSGDYGALIKVLTPGQSYTVRSFATTLAGTGYGYPIEFTTAGAADNSRPTDIVLSTSILQEVNTPPTVVGSFTAVDADINDYHGFSLEAGDGSTDNSLFSIKRTGDFWGGSTWNLILNATADFETKTSYSIRVFTGDNGTGTLGFSKVFNITVADINEAPQITSNGGGETVSLSLAENTPEVTTLVASDPDLPAQTLSFEIAGGPDAALFSIGATTGALVFQNAPDFEQAADSNADNRYEVVVRVVDSGSPAASATQEFVISVTDIPEAPALVSASATPLSDTRAMLTAEVLTSGAGNVTGRGFVVAPAATTAKPMLGGDGVVQIAVPGTTGSFEAIIASLSANTSYTVRGYATNAVGTGYSAPFSFVTLAPGTAPAFTYADPFEFSLFREATPKLPISTGGRMTGEAHRNVTTFSGNGSLGSTNGTLSNARFNRPWGLAMDSNGNIYVADDGNQRVRKISLNGVVSDFGNGIQYPRAVAVDSDNNVYVASNNHAIYKITQSGTTTVFAGAVNSSGRVDSATATTARFNNHEGLAIDPTSTYMLVADRGNNKIRKIVLATGSVTTFAGSATNVAGITDGPALDGALFKAPFGIAFAPDGNTVYVSEIGSATVGADATDRIRKISLSGETWTVSTLAGGTANAGLLDGSGTSARFNEPRNLAVDPQGNIYVGDGSNHAIRRITPDGVVSTLAGSLVPSSGNSDGIGYKARFNDPRGLLFDPAGFLYVSDTNNHQIRRISLAGYEISHPLPKGMSFDSSSGAIGGRPEEFTFGNHYVQDFNSSSLGDGSVSGHAAVAGNLLRLTTNATSQLGGFTVPGSGVSANEYRVSFTLVTTKASGGADGISYSFAADGNATAASPAAEIGTGTGLSLSFATFNNNAGIRLYYGASKAMTSTVGNSALLAYSNLSSWRGGIVPVVLRIDDAGLVNVSVNGTEIFSNVQLPGSFLTADRSEWSHYFKARTGTNSDLHAIDDLAIQEGRAPGDYQVTAYNLYGKHSENVSVDVGFSPVLTAGTAFIRAGDFKASGLALSDPALVAAAAPHAVLTLVDNAGSSQITGTFTDLPEGSTVTSTFNGDTFSFRISYKGGDGNDITLTRIPSSGQKDNCLVTTFAGENRAISDLLRPYGLANDRLGNLYAADQNKHQIIKFTPNGNLSVFSGNGAGHADGAAATAKFSSPMGLTLDSQGSVYVADWGSHRIRKITQASLQSTAGSVVSTIGGNGTSGTADGDAATSRFNYPHGIKVDALDKIYVADSSNNAVRMISTTGNVTTVAPPTGRNFPALKDIIPDANGDFYVAIGTSGSRYENNTYVQLGSSILKFTASPLALNDFSGNGTAGFADGPAGSAKFSGPSSMARDFLGRIWVADSGNHRVRRVATDGSVETMAGSTQGNATGLGAAALFNNPTFISVDGAGVVYVADSSNFLIRKIVSTARPFLGEATFTKAGAGEMQMAIPVVANGFTTSVSLTYQAAGSASVTVPVPLVSPNSVSEQTANLTLNGIQDNTVYNYTLTATNVDGPISKSGTFVFLDAAFSPDQPVILSANGFNASGIPLGDVTLGFAPVPHQSLMLVENESSADIQGTFTGLPEGTILPVTFAGNTFNLQISYKGGDGNDVTLMRVSKAGQISNGLEWRVTTFAGHLPGNPMFQPFEMARDSSGNCYVTDWGAHVIWKISPEGVISNFAGYANSKGTQNGNGQNARFYNPHSIVIDKQDTIYVSDHWNQAIRKITQSGTVTTFAGTIGSSGNTNGNATTARFSFPRGMTIDPAGNIFVLDDAGIRKITPSGDVSTLPAGQFYNPDNIGFYSDGTPVVSNSSAYSIVRVNGNGTNSIIAGNYTTPGSIDGTGGAARFGKSSLSRSSIFFSVDPFDNIYAADTLNHTIRRVAPDGVVTTIAGTGGTNGTSDGIGLAARFYEPRGMFFSPTGEMYVVDTLNKRIRRMTAGALPITRFSDLTAAPTQATLRGTVNPNGFITSARFEYGTTTALGSSVNATIQNPGSQDAQAVSATITGLVPLQTYYYRLVATNVDGVSTSQTGSFPATHPPAFAAAPAAPSPTYHTALVSSVISDDGGIPVLERGILFDEVTGEGDLVLENTTVRRSIHSGNATSTFQLTATNLKPNTNYRVRAYATSAAGTGYSSVGTFKTGEVRVETVHVGNPGNVKASGYGYGAVANEFRMGRYEVTNWEYTEFLNAVDPEGSNPAGIYSASMTTDARGGILFSASAAAGSKYAVKNLMGSKPVVHVSWFDAARFSNWVHNGYVKFQTTLDSYSARETGAYSLLGATSGSFPRARRATAWIPSEDEWFKSAYFRDTAGYMDFATGLYFSTAELDQMNKPLSVAADSLGNGLSGGQGYRLNWFNGASWNGLVGTAVTVGTSGGGSFYGTYDQDGNVEEWTESSGAYSGTRVTRGGNWSSGGGTSSGPPMYMYFLNPSQAGIAERQSTNSTQAQTDKIGFRIATSMGPLPETAPVVFSATTSASILANVAILGGGIDYDGGDPITEYGVVASPSSINAAPTIGGTGVIKFAISGSKSGEFSLSVSGLQSETSYSFRAYATNGIGTDYSSSGTFTTLPDAPSILYEGTDFAFPVGEPVPALAPTNSGGAVAVLSNIRQVTAGTELFEGQAGNSIGLDPSGNTVLADYDNHKIYKISPSKQISVFAGSDWGAADGIGEAAQFYSPSGVTLASDGTMFVVEQHPRRLRKISPQASVSFLAGSSSTVSDGQGAAAGFVTPYAGALDSDGNLIVTDDHPTYPTTQIRKVTPDGMVSTIYSGPRGFADGPIASAQFATMAGIVIDPLGNIYIADTGNHRIRKITPDGIVSTLAGSSKGYANGVGDQARFDSPENLAIDAGMNLYITESRSYRIRRVTQAGVVTTVAGTGSGGYKDGPADSAQFFFPRGILVDSDWNIVVAENTSLHWRLRKVSAQGFTIKPGLPKGMTFDADTGAIGGTPLEVAPSASYTVTAYNLVGSSSYTFDLAITGIGAIAKPAMSQSVTASSFTASGALLAGNVSSDGGDLILEKGFVIALKSANATPQIGGAGVVKIVVAGQATGAFSKLVTSLLSNTEYAFRAYATNSIGTSYSGTGNFTTLVDPVAAALAKISAYADNSTASAPSVDDFAAAGVTGVDSGNLSAILSALASSAIGATAADSVLELQDIVTAYARILAEANGVSEDASPGSEPTAADFLAIGAQTASGLGANGLALLNSVIDSKEAAAVGTVSAIESLAEIVSRMLGVVEGGVAQPALAAADFAALGVNGVTAGNLSAVLAALAQSGEGGSGVASLSLLQAVVNSVVGAMKPIENWRLTHFGNSANSGDAADFAAPRKDGVPNLIKYALCLDPVQMGGLPQAQIDGGRLKLAFRRDSARTDVTIIVEGSSDLEQDSWQPVASSVGGAAFSGQGSRSETQNPDGTRDVEVLDTAEIGTHAKRFMRVRVERAAEP